MTGMLPEIVFDAVPGRRGRGGCDARTDLFAAATAQPQVYRSFEPQYQTQSCRQFGYWRRFIYAEGVFTRPAIVEPSRVKSFVFQV